MSPRVARMSGALRPMVVSKFLSIGSRNASPRKRNPQGGKRMTTAEWVSWFERHR